MPLVRLVCLPLFLIGICAFWAGEPVAKAQLQPTLPGSGGSSGSSTATANGPVKSDFVMRLLRDKGNGNWVLFSDYELKRYFNRARCQCDTPVRLEVYFSTTGVAKKTVFGASKGDLTVLIGDSACLAADPTTRSGAKCQPLPGGQFKLSSFAKSSARATFDFPSSMLYGLMGKECTKEGTQYIRMSIDADGNQTPDLGGDAAPLLTIAYDGAPPTPPNPEFISVMGGNEALEVNWSQTDGIADFGGYTVFCSRAENLQVFNPSYYSEQYFSQTTVCGKETPTAQASVTQLQDATATPGMIAFATTTPSGNSGTGGVAGSDDNGIDAGTSANVDPSSMARGPFAAPNAFSNLNKDFVCSDLLRTQRSARITGLQNGIPYLVGVAAIDFSGNASPITKVFLQTPVATRDFYNGYREAGGQAQGGFCAFGGRAGRGVTPVFALATLALVIRGLARRRRRR
jgi:hypothetical protein